jgi:glycosyltransferase involved in cell wall biosynthesis
METMGTVVIGRNEGERLVRCIGSLPKNQKGIVYVDSGSTDSSVTAAEHFGCHVLQLDPEAPFTAGRARNEGFEALMAAHPDLEYVQFIDGDCELAAGWLSAALTFLSDHPDVAVVCGRLRERYPEASVYNQLCDQEWNTPVGETSACGGNSLARAVAFSSAGGFKPELKAGEEPELCLRLRTDGWRVWRLDFDMAVHDAAIHTFRQWWLRSVRSGYGFAQVWAVTRTNGTLYKKELRSAVLWAGVIPAALALSALLSLWLPLLLAAVYPFQVTRIAFRRGAGRKLSWVYGLMMVTNKFAELRGVAKFVFAGRGAPALNPIEYK